jgi:ankyrin repeat protein
VAVVADASKLSPAEVAELAAAFRDLINYEGDDPTAAIDPFTYRRPDGDTCLHIAAHRADVRSVALLLKAGADPNDLGDMRSTPLHYAKDPRIIQMLLAAGASDKIKNAFGRTPLEQI